jgi:GNAT superfamily N-acetyltransferase
VFLTSERERERFAQLTYPRFVPCLTEPGSQCVAIGAVAEGRPIGLALAQLVGTTARLLSLNVERAWRERGIGTALLAECESALALRGAVEIVTRHSSRTLARFAFERTLAVARWDRTQLATLRVTARCGPMLEAVGALPVMRRLLAQNEYVFSPWTDRDKGDQEAIEHLGKQPPCRNCPALMPNAYAIEPATSLLIRRGKRLVGWVITERQHAAGEALPSIHYAAVYVDMALWHTPVMMAGAYHAFTRQVAAFGPLSVVGFETSVNTPRMIALIQRRLAPLALSVDEVFVTRKCLGGT